MQLPSTVKIFKGSGLSGLLPQGQLCYPLQLAKATGQKANLMSCFECELLSGRKNNRISPKVKAHRFLSDGPLIQ
jgi:hypothetical protein